MISEAAILCMALNGYHEARSESRDAQLAVHMVVLNRAKRNTWRVCNVIFEPYQFSWTTLPPAVANRAAFETSKQIAFEAFNTVDFTGGATHYHITAMQPPRWTKGMTQTGVWGAHVFYRKSK